MIYKDTKDTFTHIYDNYVWNSKESVSGSIYEYHIPLIKHITKFIKDNNIKSILDVCCGDFNWMKDVDLSNITYLGVDVVDDLIKVNNEIYSSDSISFKVSDATNESFDKYDLVICKDCLYHLPYKESKQIINNIIKSNSKHLMSSTFYKHGNVNIQIGRFYFINLEKYPFNFPQPHTIYKDYYGIEEENYFNNSGGRKDKSIGIWNINELNLYDI